VGLHQQRQPPERQAPRRVMTHYNLDDDLDDDPDEEDDFEEDEENDDFDEEDDDGDEEDVETWQVFRKIEKSSSFFL
jgi:hypothetical protein